MKVLVVGSIRGIDSPETAQSVREAGKQIGAQLAERGHTVLVGTDDNNDIDPSVAEGVFSINKQTSTIEVHTPQGIPKPYPNHTGKNINRIYHPFPDWDVTTAEVVQKVDAVLAVAGRAGVIQAGLSGWMAGLAVIPVACFGGGAKKLWEYGSSRRHDFYHGALRDDQIDRLAAPWDEQSSAAFVVQTLEEVERASKVSRTSTKILLSILVVLIFSLATWVFFLTFPFVAAPRLISLIGPWDSKDSLVILFMTVSASGLLGASMQTLRTIRNGASVTFRVILVDTGLGVTAGIVMAMLYLLAQIAVSGRVEPNLNPEDFVRVALIVSMGSLFASLYLDAALARFDKIKGSVFTGKYSSAEPEQ